MDSNYAAGVVLFKPNIKRLKINLEAVAPQVGKVFCYNNGLEDSEEVIALLNSFDNVELIGDGTNVGIATALNELMRTAYSSNFTWLLTLDQDSVVPQDMIKNYASLTHEDAVALICPLILDVRRKNENFFRDKNKISEIDVCMTSGSFMNIDKTMDVGGFDDYLFIDWVDDEICYRLKLNGYRILRNNDVVLNHELGIITPSKYASFWLKLGDLLHSETVKKLSHKRQVNAMREYYGARNMLYLRKKYKYCPHTARWNQTANLYLDLLSSWVRSGFDKKVISNILKGLEAGRTVDVKPYKYMQNHS